jgi:hypothetical protein
MANRARKTSDISPLVVEDAKFDAYLDAREVSARHHAKLARYVGGREHSIDHVIDMIEDRRKRPYSTNMSAATAKAMCDYFRRAESVAA